MFPPKMSGVWGAKLYHIADTCFEHMRGKLVVLNVLEPTVLTCYIGSVVVVSHIQRIGCQPEKNYFTRWPIPLVVC